MGEPESGNLGESDGDRGMKRKAVVVFCLLALFFGVAFPAGAQSAAVYSDAEIIWQQQGVAVNETVMKANNRLYISADGLRRLGFRVQWLKEDNRFVLSHGDAKVKERFSPVYYRDQVIVLMYHALADEPQDSGILSADDFRRQMKLLKEKHFNVIDMEQYADFILNGAAVPDNAVLLTFDDGYENFYTHAFPVLKEFGYPATNFVIVNWIDNPVGLPKLTWDQMREMQQYGISFYSHTHDSHYYGKVDEAGRERPALTSRLYLEALGRTETEEEYAARVLADLKAAETRLREELGNTYGVLAFPYGAHNNQVLQLAEQAGIRFTFTIKAGINGKENRNGYRLNAGYRGNDGREMTARMQLGLCEDPDCKPSLYFGEDPIVFQGEQPVVINGKLWVPLRELLERFRLGIQLEKEPERLRIL